MGSYFSRPATRSEAGTVVTTVNVNVNSAATVNVNAAPAVPEVPPAPPTLDAAPAPAVPAPPAPDAPVPGLRPAPPPVKAVPGLPPGIRVVAPDWKVVPKAPPDWKSEPGSLISRGTQSMINESSTPAILTENVDLENEEIGSSLDGAAKQNPFNLFQHIMKTTGGGKGMTSSDAAAFRNGVKLLSKDELDSCLQKEIDNVERHEVMCAPLRVREAKARVHMTRVAFEVKFGRKADSGAKEGP